MHYTIYKDNGQAGLLKLFEMILHCHYWKLHFNNAMLSQHKCYIVATVDRDLKRRIRKIPGVPIMYISNHR